jgi:hypothetical protein
MVDKANLTLLNFVGGEVSPLMAARNDIELLQKSLAWAQNFIILPQGGASYRPGTRCIGLTKGMKVGTLIPFQFNAADAIVLANTEENMRFYRDSAVILNTAIVITAATKAEPCVITAVAHGFSDGDEVFIDDVVGMTNLNKRLFIVANSTTDTIELTDHWGDDIDSTDYETYVSGGTVASIYEVDTPYAEADLSYIRYAQTGDIMYLVCRNSDLGSSYAPYKLIRNDFTDWTLNTFKRKNDPFVAATHTVFTVLGVTQASPAVVHVASTTGLTTGDVLQATAVGGMTELNGNFYQITVVDATHFSLQDADGNDVDATGYAAFTSGGKFTLRTRDPGGVAFATDGRLIYTNTEQNPEGFWASRLPTTRAQSRFDDFTIGTASDYAAVYNFAPVDDKVDEIVELKQFGGNFALLGSSSIRQVYGPSPGTPPTPTSINTVPSIQGAARVRPLVINWDLVFVDVNRRRLRGLQYNLAFSSYAAVDYNLASSHFGEESPFIKMAWVKGHPDCIWILREDGVLLSITFNNLENIAAWSRHYMGADGKVLDIASIRNSEGRDELWLIVERTFGLKTYRTIEVMSQWPVFPLRRRFYTGVVEDDEEAWRNAAWEIGKDPAFLDMVLEFDGRTRATSGLTVEAYVPPGLAARCADSVFIPDADIEYAGTQNAEYWYTERSGSRANLMTLSSDCRYLYVGVATDAYVHSAVLKIDTATGDITAQSASFIPQIQALLLDDDGAFLYALCYRVADTTAILVFDTSDMSLVDTLDTLLPVGADISGYDFSGTGMLMTSYTTDKFYVYDTGSTLELTHTIAGATSISAGCWNLVDPPLSGGHCYIQYENAGDTHVNDVFEYDAVTGLVFDTFTLTGLPAPFAGSATRKMPIGEHPTTGHIYGCRAQRNAADVTIHEQVFWVLDPATGLTRGHSVQNLDLAPNNHDRPVRFIAFDPANTSGPYYAYFLTEQGDFVRVDQNGVSEVIEQLRPSGLDTYLGYGGIAIDGECGRAYFYAQTPNPDYTTHIVTTGLT